MEALRPSDVLHDLGLERFRAGPLDFGAEAVEKLKFNRSFFAQVRRIVRFEVEDVRLDGEGGFAEGRPVADVGDGLKAARGFAVPDGQPGHVDAKGRE